MKKLLFLLVGFAAELYSYDSDIHQQLTFLAAKQYSKCAEVRPGLYRPSALDVRYLVRANVAQADAGFFSRLFRWNYYSPDPQDQKDVLWVIETRFQGHYRSLLRQIELGDKAEDRLKAVGRVISYLQDVTSPPRVVPVFTGRWWRFSFSDRFDRFPVDADAIDERLVDSCDRLGLDLEDFESLLSETANSTVSAIKEKISGYPVTWEAFWSFGEQPGEFGEYGIAGNQFGKRSSFRCPDEERCLLLEDDPLYQEFALQRHVEAVRATMKALLIMQNYFE
ncbi:MAG: hypothetical protein ACJ0Q3_01175 [Candidatus Azotimanducaceae bacterium]